jgi:hypothetical protein
MHHSKEFKDVDFLVVAFPQLATLFIFSCILFLYSFRLISLLMQSHGDNNSNNSPTSSELNPNKQLNSNSQNKRDVEIKMKLIIRIAVVTLICIACYLLRIVIYLLAAYDMFSSNPDNDDTQTFSQPLWYLLTDWIPTTGPVSPFHTGLLY